MGQRPPADASPEAKVAWANDVLRDYNRYGPTMRMQTATWGTAIFAPMLTLISFGQVFPPVSHAMHSHGGPVYLVSTLFFGLPAWLAIRKLLRVQRAKRYLRENPQA